MTEDGEDDSTIRRRWSGTGTPTVEAVRSIAALTGQDPLDVGPLSQTVDPDALDRLFERGDDELTVSFTHEQVHVTVRGNGTVEARSQS